MVLYCFEMALAVPEGVVGIEGNDADIVEINHFLQWGQVPLIIKFEEWALKPSGNWMSGISA
jgi:putative heme iron utilization protein